MYFIHWRNATGPLATAWQSPMSGLPLLRDTDTLPGQRAACSLLMGGVARVLARAIAEGTPMETDGAQFSDYSDYIEYTDAEEYDRENGLTGPELPFYLGLAREVGGPALDLACGTGFLTIPLAEQGLTVTGVDLAPAMLDHARPKAGAPPA